MTDFKCPHCGHAMRDAWEYFDGDETCPVECDECGKTFLLCQEVTVQYYTQMIFDKESGK